MILDTNVVIQHIRKQIPISSRAVLPIVVVGELEAFALKSDWGYQKMVSLNTILEKIPIADIDREITQIYAKVDAYSQGKERELNNLSIYISIFRSNSSFKKTNVSLLCVVFLP
jgi:tRNA(fMet)-specific endonuclease VapC